MTPLCRLALLLVCASAAALVRPEPGRAAAELMPHRAIYDLSLAAARSTRTVTDVDGRMSFVWKDVCDGWSIDYRTRMQMFFGREGGQEVSWKYSSWESNDGTRFRYFLRRFRDGRETERLRGEAELAPEGGGTATVIEPEPREVDLPPDTLFPKAHTEKLLAAARAGERFLYAHIFDGTGESGLYAVNSAILGRADAKPPELDSPLLKDVPSWRVTLAFFPPGESDGTPESEQSMRVYANGVAGSMRIDYGDFVLRAELTDLERLESPRCR